MGAQRRALESDRAALAAAEAGLASARVSLQASVASVYCNVRVFEKRIQVAVDNLKQQAENMRIAELRFRLGATSELDWRQAQTQFRQTEAQLPALSVSLAQNQHALSVLLGKPRISLPGHLLPAPACPRCRLCCPWERPGTCYAAARTFVRRS